MEGTGIYKTKQRDLVLTCIKQLKKGHITAEELYLQLQENKTPVGKSTVYRYLNVLVQEGIVMKYVLEEGAPACYQYIGSDCVYHYHLKCSHCGTLFHVESELLDQLEAHLREQFQFCLDHTKTVLYGVCEQCEQNQKRKE